MPYNPNSFGAKITKNRRPNQEFTPEQRAAMVAEIYTGKSTTQVARDYGTTSGTVSKIKARFKEQYNNASRSR